MSPLLPILLIAYTTAYSLEWQSIFPSSFWVNSFICISYGNFINLQEKENNNDSSCFGGEDKCMEYRV